MSFSIAVASIDDVQARVSKETLTEQAIMEILIQTMETKCSFAPYDDEYLDLPEWMGVRLDDSGSVIDIEWPYDDDCDDDDESDDILYISQGGSIDFKWLPGKLRLLNISLLSLNGSIDTEVLPSTLEELTVDGNQLEGAFSIAGLPRSIISVDISRNKFEGSLQLPKLPQGMVTFRAASNLLSGVLDCTSLPLKLEQLELSSNQFCGSVDLRSLPSGLQIIRLQKNSISQRVIYVDHTAKSLVAISFDAEEIVQVEMTNGKLPNTYTPSKTCNVSFS